MQPELQPLPPSPARPRLSRPSARLVLYAIVAAAVLVAAITAIPLALSPWSLVAHFECGPGATAATRDLWTPWVLINAPYGGFGNATGSLVAGMKWNTTVSHGAAAGIFEVAQWTIATSVRVLVAGPGPNAMCTGYVATPKLLGSYAGMMLMRTGNATSDAGENTSFSFSGYDSVLFHNGYFERDLSVDTCPGGPVVLGATASRMSVDVPFTLDGANHTASGTLTGAFNYTYSLPGNSGVWLIDDLDVGANAPGGGWAFSFVPCP